MADGFNNIIKSQKADTLQRIISELSAYKYALDASAIVAITDQKGIIRHVNDNFCEISGYSEAELIGQDHRIINSGYHDKDFIKNLWSTIASGKVWEGDICNRRKDGSIYWVATTIVPFLNDLGKPYQYAAIRFDRTEAKLARQQLIEKNDQISSLLESINDGFIGLDHELRYTYVNQRTCEMVGMKAEDMIGKKMWDLFPDAVGSATWLAVQKALVTGLPVTNEDYYAPLSLWQENHIYPNENGLSIFISDITWRKQEEEQKNLLADISYIFNQDAPLNELMDDVMQRLSKFSSSFCLTEIWLAGRDNKQLTLRAQTSTCDEMKVFFDEHPDLRQLQAEEGLPGVTWANGTVMFWPNLEDHTSFLRGEAAKKVGLLAGFGIPLRHNEKLIGVLLLGQNCTDRPEHLKDALLTKLGDHLGTAISRRQLENDFQGIFEAAPDIICIVGTDRLFKKVNPAMCTLLNYSEAELLAMPIDALIHRDDANESRDRMWQFVNSDQNTMYFENRYLTKTGQVVDLAWTASKGKEDSVLFCIARNVSDKKILEAAANRFLTDRNTILESIGDAFFSVDKDWIVQYWNNVAEKTLQIPKEVIVGKKLWSVFKSSIDSNSYKKYQEAIRSGKVKHFEDYYETLDKWYDISVYPSDSGLSVFFKDITERKRVEQELQVQAAALEISNQRYSDLFQVSPLPKFVFDSDTLAFLDVNKAAVHHYGYSKKEFLTMTLQDIRPESEFDMLDKAVKSANRSAYFYQPGIFTHRKKNGELIRVEITSSAIDYDGRSARIALAMDVTERLKHLEAIEVQNQQLKEISWMQSHIIRAPLARIMGLVELIDSTSPDKSETTEILDYIKLSANELDGVIRAIIASANKPSQL